MALTHPLLFGYFESFGGPTTVPSSQNVGSGANRRIDVILGWSVNAKGIPSAFSVGSDTLTMVGSVYNAPAGGNYAHFSGALTVSGAQNLVGTFTGAFDSGAARYLALVSQGDGALTASNVLSALETAFGGGGGSVTRTVTSSGTDTLVALVLEKSAGGSTASAASGSTLISGSNSADIYTAAKRAGSSPSAAVGVAFSTFTEAISIAFALSEAGGAPVITGPSGGPGASTSAANLVEGATSGPTMSTDIAPGGGYPTLTGTDASLFTLTTLSSTSWRIDPNPAKNFEAPADAGANNVYDIVFNASASVSQAVAITVTNANEAPTFTGSTVGPLSFTAGSPITPVDISALGWTEPDAGDTATYSLVGSWPAGLSVVGVNLQGTPAVGTGTGVAFRRVDAGGLGGNTNTFNVTVTAGSTAPAVTTQPSNLSVSSGGSASFTAAFSGSPTPTLQWQEFISSVWTDMAGQTSGTLSLGTVTVGDTGRQFRCRGTNVAGGPIATNAATLTVSAPGTYSATVGQLAEGGIAMAAGRTIYWTLQMGNGPGGLSGGAQGTATTDASGNISVSHSVAGRAMVTCSTVAPGTVNDLRPVQTQIVVLA